MHYLFTIIEGSDNQGHTFLYNKALGDMPKVDYEKEAISCFAHWRKHAGIYKDIPIICICPSDKKIKRSTIEEFEKLNVIYMDMDFPETKQYPCSWFYVPLVGKYLESEYLHSEDTLVHIDLDMYTLKEPPHSIMNVEGYTVNCARYDDHCVHLEERGIRQGYPQYAVTCFMASKAGSGFYQTYWDILTRFAEDIRLEQIEKGSEEWFDYCCLEEHVIDVLKFDKGYPINYINNIMMGPGYHSKESIEKNNCLNTITWIHCHEHDNYDKFFMDYTVAKIENRSLKLN